MTFETKDPDIWLLACRMCADDCCFWSCDDDGSLSLLIMCSDVFAPCADSEALLPEDVPAVHAAWQAGTLMDWVAERRK